MTGSSSPTAAQMFLAAVGEQILTCRETAGLTQEELAERLGLTTERIDDIEHGWFDPSLALIQRLANALHTSPHELLDVGGSELGIAATELAKRNRL